jgi:hypothetical protein
MKRHKRYLFAALILAALVFTAGCSDDDDDPVIPLEPTNITYRITWTNITANQPHSPFAVVLHLAGYVPWEPGIPASAGLEQLAESGGFDDFLMEAAADSLVIQTANGNGVIAPGQIDSIEITLENHRDNEGLRFSTASMLVNTNDAFAGLSGKRIDDLAPGEMRRYTLPAYDAGTEADNETAAAIPGPAGGGEGFNPLRDDTNSVSIHAGVITADDGLMGSALTESHRFDNPVAGVTVERLP